jgi:tape measure domain-containing protein
VTVAELTAKVTVVGESSARRAFASIASGAKNAGEAIRTAADATRLLAIAQENIAKFSGVQAAIAFDSQIRGLAAYSRNADELQNQLGRLQEIAKLPGLGLSEVRQGVLSLEAAGLTATLAERSIKAFGNALALAGRGKAELDGVILALSQIASKGALSAEEINQIAERVPQIRQVLVQAFGTASTEAIQNMGMTATDAIGKIITGLEQLPKAAGGIQNTLDNLSDLFDQAVLPIGRGIGDMLIAATPAMENMIGLLQQFGLQIGQVFTAIGQSGVLADVLAKIGGQIGGPNGIAEPFAKFISYILSFIAQLPTIVQAAVANVQNGLNEMAAFAIETFGSLFAGISELANAFLPSGLAQRLGFSGSGVSAATAGIATAIRSSNIAVPEFNIGGLADQYFQKIKEAYGTQALPSDLIFGKPSELGGTSSSSLLGKIEANTRSAAESLQLDRRITGGGAIAQMGATASEIRAANMSAGSGYGVSSNSISGGNYIERHIRRTIMDEIRRSGGYAIPRG